MNILFVNYGALETNSIRHIGGFASLLGQHGHDCVVAVPLPPSEEEAARLKVPCCGYREALSSRSRFRNGKGADLLHGWTPRETTRIFCQSYLAAHKTPLVIHLEDNEAAVRERTIRCSEQELLALPAAEAEDLLPPTLSHPRHAKGFLAQADCVSVITEELSALVPANKPIMVVPPYVDLSLFAPAPPDAALRSEWGLPESRLVVAYTGGLNAANESDFYDLLQALQQLHEDGAPCHLLTTGGILRGNCLERFPDLEALWTDLGWVDEAMVPRVLNEADVLIQPGRLDDFNRYRLPSKLPEYLAVGKPVILPAANIAKNLRDGTNAFLLQSGEPAEIAEKLRTVCSDPGKAVRIGNAARTFAEEFFAPERILRALEPLYAMPAADPRRKRSRAKLKPTTTVGEIVARIRLEQERMQLAHMHARVHGLQKHVESLREELRSRCQDTLDAATPLRDTLVEQRTQLEQVQTRLEELQNRHAEREQKLTRELAALQDTSRESRQAEARALDQLTQARHKLGEARDTIGQRDRQLETLGAQVATLESDMERLSRDVANAAARLNQAHNSLETSLARQEQLSSRLAKADRRVVTLGRETRTLRDEMAATVEETHRLEQAIVALKNENAAFATELSEREGQVADQEKRIAELTRNKARLEDIVQMLEGTRVGLEGQVASQRAEIERHREERSQLFAEIGGMNCMLADSQVFIETMVNTFSWRITKPLRLATRWFRSSKAWFLKGLQPKS